MVVTRYTADSAAAMLADSVSSLDCKQLTSAQTRISPSKQSILDIMFANN